MSGGSMLHSGYSVPYIYTLPILLNPCSVTVMPVRNRSTTSLWTDINLEYDTQRADTCPASRRPLTRRIVTWANASNRHIRASEITAETQDGPDRQ